MASGSGPCCNWQYDQGKQTKPVVLRWTGILAMPTYTYDDNDDGGVWPKTGNMHGGDRDFSLHCTPRNRMMRLESGRGQETNI